MFPILLFIREIFIEQQLHGGHSAREGTGMGRWDAKTEGKYDWGTCKAYGLVEERKHVQAL